jgi:hypothetical protein
MPTPSDALPTFSCLNRWRCNDHRLLWTFAPAALVWPLYFFVMATLEAWNEVFVVHWPMTVAMIAGSFLAGSTPLGGGVVAYPVSQLVLHVSTAHARDASVLVQSVGMNAAAWLILVSKVRDCLIGFCQEKSPTAFGN